MPTTPVRNATQGGGEAVVSQQLPRTGQETRQLLTWALALVGSGVAMVVTGVRGPRRVRQD